MKVQFAVDCISLAKGIELANQIRDCIEIIELGEEFIAKYGHMAIREFKQEFPEKKILADIKIMDSGYKVGLPCLEAGADIITVHYECNMDFEYIRTAAKPKPTTEKQRQFRREPAGGHAF
mgnify:CR=1 FL=1